MRASTVLILLIVLVAALTTLLAPSATLAGDNGKAEKLFVEKHRCNTCHAVASAGIDAKTTSEGMKGPDLSGYKPEQDFAKLAAFLRKQADLNGEQHKKGFKGSDEELQAIIDWLGSLEARK